MGKKLTSATLKATDGPDNVITGEYERTIYNTSGKQAGNTAEFGYADYGKNYEVSSNYIVYGYPNGNGERSSEGLPLDTFSAQGFVKIYNGRNGNITNASTPQLITTITPPETPINPFNSISFGTSVAISPDQTKIAIGCSNYDDASGDNSGRVYLYSTGPNAEDWQLLHTYTNPNFYGTPVGDGFGYSVDLSNTHLVVGAINEDTASYNSVGAAYVFHTTSSNQYGLTRSLQSDANPIESSDSFGFDVAIYGDYVGIGAPNEDITSTYDEYGRIYIYNHTTGGLLASTNPYVTYNSSYRTYAGRMVRANSSRFFFAGYYDGRYGAIYSYTHTGSSGGNIQGTYYNGNFGLSFDVDYDHLYVGIEGSNVVQCFDASSLTNQGVLTNPNINSISASDDFGIMVRCNNADRGSYCTQVHVGARFEDVADSESGYTGVNAGIIYIFDDGNGTASSMIRDYDWRAPSDDLDFNKRYDEYFGIALAVSSNKIVVGAPLVDFTESTTQSSNSGEAYVYSLETGALLTNLENPNIIGTRSSDYFGACVEISDDYIVVSAMLEDVGGVSQSGVVYVYDASTYQLLRQIYNPNNYSTGGDQFGGASSWDTSSQVMAISGNYLIVGVPYEDSTNNNVGVAYVFNLTNGQLIRTHSHPTNTNAYFGWSVCANDTYYYIASVNGNEYTLADYGGVTCYDLATGTEQWVTGQTSENLDEFGFSMACSNDNLVVGHRNSDAVGTNQGKIWVFDAETGALRFFKNNPANVGYSASSDHYGWSVDVDDNHILVGAPYTDITYTVNGYTYNTSDTGVVYQYDLDGTTEQTYALNELTSVYGHTNVSSSRFGQSVRLFNGGLLIAAPYRSVNYNNSGSGMVFKFT